MSRADDSVVVRSPDRVTAPTVGLQETVDCEAHLDLSFCDEFLDRDSKKLGQSYCVGFADAAATAEDFVDGGPWNLGSAGQLRLCQLSSFDQPRQAVASRATEEDERDSSNCKRRV